MFKKMRSFYLVAIMLLIAVTVNAQVTTASMSGKVSSGVDPIIGATILAIHEASGTRYGAITNIDGRYTIEGMRTGNYLVEVSYVGFTTLKFTDVMLRLGENYVLNVEMKESSELLDEVVVVANKSKFSDVKTGATTNISNKQLTLLPTINRSLTDFTRLSPYAGSGTSLAGRDGRTNSFTIDGANLNNNFGLSDDLPGGGNPISLDAIEEVQVVIAPFDVRQTNFVGGGVNAITKSGNNTFRGSAYTYQRNENFRGNKIDGERLGDREKESKSTYGFTLGGPIIKDKLFFFVNGEYENAPAPITKWKLSTDGKANKDNLISRVTAADMQGFADILQNTYGYDPGSYTNYDGGAKNYKVLARVDWNITNNHKLSVRYNWTKNTEQMPTNATSTVGTAASNGRISYQSMAFRNACYGMENSVSSLTAELNSRFGNSVSNRFLLTYTNMEAPKRTSESSPFPFIDIWKDGDAFMSAGYELFSWKNRVNNKVFNFQDNVTWTLGNHKLVGGLSFEYQKALNSFMRNGTGYYRYESFDAFKRGDAPVAFGLTYGYNGDTNPEAVVSFAQSSLYLQDEWNATDNFKLTYGVRADMMNFLNDLQTNEAYKALDWKDHFIAKNNSDYATYQAPRIDTGKWPKSSVLFSPRVGFNWDIMGDKSLVIRGGTGIFTGHIPLVFFTNMPTNAGMIQNLISFTQKDNQADLNKLAGGLTTDVNGMIEKLGLPTSSPFSNPNAKVEGATVVAVDNDFKMPQVWKNTLAIDYTLPASFPLTLTVEGMYNKDINAVTQDNYNVTNVGNLERFAGPDNRYNYKSATVSVQTGVTNGAMVLTNTSKGYSGSINVMANAEPIKNLNVMASYTHTIAKEITGLPGSQAYSAWRNLPNVDGPNTIGLHNSQYLTPNKVIASVSYTIGYGKNKNFATNVGLFYSGYASGFMNYYYNNDMNGDGQNGYDLIYIPKTKDELTFADAVVNGETITAAEQAETFWKFVNQDGYLSKHKGEYAEAYGANMPWVHRFDLKIAQDFKLKVGKSMNTLQVSFDFLNIGNLINSSWGVTKTSSSCNYGKILQLKEVKNNVPVYTLYNKNTPLITNESTTYIPYRNSTNCWQLQIGVRYIFN